MKPSIKIFLILTIGWLNFSLSQTNMLEVSPSRIKSRINIPPIEQVIDSVLKNNGMLNYRKKSVQRLETIVKSRRIDLSRHIGLTGETRYGNFNNFSTNDNGQVVSPIATTSTQFNYSGGVYVRIPFYDIFNRGKLIKAAKLEVEEAKSLADAQRQNMRQMVINLYQDIVLKERLLEISAKSFGDGKVNMEMVEKEFRNGLVPVAEYVRITNITASLEMEYEKAKSDFILAKQILEDLAGFKFDIITAN